MKPKNTICLWFDKDAHEAARFYAVTFPDSKVTAVYKAPGDYPGGKKRGLSGAGAACDNDSTHAGEAVGDYDAPSMAPAIVYAASNP